MHRAGVKRLHHPVVGDLSLAYESMELTADAGLRLTAYTAEAGSRAQDALNPWPAGPPPRRRGRPPARVTERTPRPRRLPGRCGPPCVRPRLTDRPATGRNRPWSWHLTHDRRAPAEEWGRLASLSKEH